MEVRIWIMPDGTIHHLYNEEVDLSGLGETTIERASDVRFDNDDHRWKVKLLEEGRTATIDFGLRSDALAWEKDYLEDRGPWSRHGR